MIMDKRGRIMLVNESFKHLHREADKVSIGQKVSNLKWLNTGFENSGTDAPWDQVLQEQKSVARQSLKIPKGFNGERELRVNASPIFDGYDKLRGCMVSMQDVTDLLEAVEQIQVQNKKLHQLANFDHLTGLLNRRALFDQGDRRFAEYQENGSINDNHGHSSGDEAIKIVTDFLKDMVRSSDLVGRYGGEEFVIVLPGATQEVAERVAERFRRRIEEEAGKGVTSVPGLTITSSFGVALLTPEIKSLADLIDQADKALYYSKENGRNKVTTFGPGMLGD
jgi:diguanylate cyclase (GGDEF)-like protein